MNRCSTLSSALDIRPFGCSLFIAPPPIGEHRVLLLLLSLNTFCIAQVRKGHKCAMPAEMAASLRNCLCLYSYLHN